MNSNPDLDISDLINEVIKEEKQKYNTTSYKTIDSNTDPKNVFKTLP